MTTQTPVRPETRAGQEEPQRKKGVRLASAFYLMVLPAFLLFFVFHTIPVIQGVYYSFTDSPGYGPSEFVGLRNYIALFTDPRVLHAYWFTFLIAAVATILVNIVSLAIAIGLNGKIKFKNGLRGIYFVPNVLAILVVGYIFNYLFSNSLPALGEKLGIDALSTSLLTKASTAWIAIVILAVWQSAAFNIIIYLAGLQTVPTEMYEAADLDGASAWRQFRSVTLPLLRPVLALVLVVTVTGSFQIFDTVAVTTGGGPVNATRVIYLYIYDLAFSQLDFGYASALSVVLFAVLLVVALVQLKLLRADESDNA